MYSVVIPVYNNEASLPELLSALEGIDRRLEGELQVVFVVDGSPDRSAQRLAELLPEARFSSKLLLHSRNFGSFAALRTGLAAAEGAFFAVMAADLQEPPELMLDFFRVLQADEADVVVGTRESRTDPLVKRSVANLYWWLYRRLVRSDMPAGGVDVFGCNLAFRDQLVALDERNSSLVGLVFWLGFRRKLVPYQRLPRKHGKGAWTLRRSITYAMDSAFAFSDLPIRVLVLLGTLGLVFSVVFGSVVIAARLLGHVMVQGYAATIVTITFFAGLNTLGLGIVGSYVWRGFENSKGRPQAVVMRRSEFERKAE